MIVVVDDEDRENEGDLTMAAEMITPEAINFMATHGRGLICLAMTGERLDELDLASDVDGQQRLRWHRFHRLDRRHRRRCDDRHFGVRPRRKQLRWRLTRAVIQKTSRDQATFFHFAPGPVAFSNGAAKRKRPSTWRVSQASSPPE